MPARRRAATGSWWPAHRRPGSPTATPVPSGSRRSPLYPMRCQPLTQLCRLKQTRLTCDLSTVPEDDQGRDTADAEAPGQGLLRLGVELGESQVGLHLPGRLGEDRRHHLAGPAPGGPEVHHHRQLAALHQGAEVGLGQLDRLAGEQGGLAPAAPGSIVQARLADAVDGTTMGAAQGQGVRHGNLRIEVVGTRIWRPPPLPSSGIASRPRRPSCSRATGLLWSPHSLPLSMRLVMPSRPDPRVLLRLLGLLAPYRYRLALAALALLVASGSVLLLGQGLRLVIDRGFMAADGDALGRTLGVMLAVVAVLALASALRYYLVTWIGERLAADLRRRVFDHLLTLEPGFFESARAPGQAAGEIVSRLTADTSVLQSLFGSSVSLALRNLLMLIGAVTLMVATQPWLSAIVLLGIPATVLPILWFGRRVRCRSGIRTVQAFTHEARDRRDYAMRVEEAFASAVTRTRQRAWLTGLAMLAVFTAVGIMLWQGGQAVLAGTMTAGELSAFVFYAVLAAGAVASLAEVAGDVQRAAGAAERLLELLDARPAIAPPAHPVPLPEPLAGELRFEGVSFTYPGRETPVLAGFDLTIAPGERVALVGPSGAGKSTLLALLLRFHDPDAGTLRLDGIDLRELDPGALRSALGLVAQEPVLFTGSVADNLRYGDPEADPETLRRAARDANAVAFIEALPQGFDTPLGPGGVQLSGGQRQRLAIARALLKNPRVLLLDEATSALDAESERLVQQALDRLMVGRTSLVIAHRLATVVAADRLLVLDEGRLVAAGRHAELMASSPLYRHLAKLQFGRHPRDSVTGATSQADT